MGDQSIIQKNIFGLNVTVPRKNIEEAAKVVQQEVENITVNPFVEYFEENDRVFSGEVANEIRKYQSQMYTLGQVMREGVKTKTLNTKM